MPATTTRPTRHRKRRGRSWPSDVAPLSYRLPEYRHVVRGIDAERRRFQPPLNRTEAPRQRFRDEVWQKREVFHVENLGIGVVCEPKRQEPPLDAFVDAVERWEDIPHVETKQKISRVDLVDE